MKQTKLKKYSPHDVERYVESSLRNKKRMNDIIMHVQTAVNRLENAKFDNKKIEDYLVHFLMRQNYIRYIVDGHIDDENKLDVMVQLRSELLSVNANNIIKAKVSMLLTLKNKNALRYFYISKVRNISKLELCALFDELFTSEVFASYEACKKQSEAKLKRSIAVQEKWISSHADEYAIEQAYMNEF